MGACPPVEGTRRDSGRKLNIQYSITNHQCSMRSKGRAAPVALRSFRAGGPKGAGLIGSAVAGLAEAGDFNSWPAPAGPATGRNKPTIPVLEDFLSQRTRRARRKIRAGWGAGIRARAETRRARRMFRQDRIRGAA